MLSKKNRTALVYCRSASKGGLNGVEWQEIQCREFCKIKGYIIKKAFYDDGISGVSVNRPAMSSLLSYIKANKNETFIVVLTDLSRFARSFSIYKDLKKKLENRGTKLEFIDLALDYSLSWESINKMISTLRSHI